MEYGNYMEVIKRNSIELLKGKLDKSIKEKGLGGCSDGMR